MLAALAGIGMLAASAVAQDGPVRRDPSVPYASWGEASRETAAALEGRTLVRPADGRYKGGDAVIINDGGKAK